MSTKLQLPNGSKLFYKVGALTFQGLLPKMRARQVKKN
jgi:hypothetical protein